MESRYLLGLLLVCCHVWGFSVCVLRELGRTKDRRTGKILINQTKISRTINSAESLRQSDFSYFCSSATYFNYQTPLYHVTTISLIQISSACGKADIGETKAFCLHNTLSYHSLETPVSRVLLVTNTEKASKTQHLLTKPPSFVCSMAVTGQVLLVEDALH